MKKSILFKLFLPLYSSKGFTMIEAIATLLVGSIILGFAFNGFLSVRQIYVSDRSKLEANQRLRTIFTTIGPDIQQTGENLVSDPKLPAIEISRQNLPSSTIQTSEVILRKGVVSSSLNLCQPITKNTTSNLTVINNASTDNNCRANDFNDPIDGWPDTVKIWKGIRENKGGKVLAYLYSPGGEGEFFYYNGEEILDIDGDQMTPSAGTTPHTVNLTNNGHTWTKDYPINSIIYLIEERKFRVKDGYLQLVLNNEEVLNITENVEKLEVKAILQKEAGGTQYTCHKIPPVLASDCTPNFINPTTEYSWAQIKSIDITAKILPGEDGKGTAVLREEDLTLTQQFFPRNRLSF